MLPVYVTVIAIDDIVFLGYSSVIAQAPKDRVHVGVDSPVTGFVQRMYCIYPKSTELKVTVPTQVGQVGRIVVIDVVEGDMEVVYTVDEVVGAVEVDELVVAEVVDVVEVG